MILVTYKSDVHPRWTPPAKNVTGCPHHGGEGGTATVDDGKASGHDEPQWRPDDAEVAAGRDARPGRGPEGGGDLGRRASFSGPPDAGTAGARQPASSRSPQQR